jgi:tryptophan-rich sensory protein
MKSVYKLILSVTLPVVIGWISSYFTASSVKTWFITLQKPSFNPPPWLFAPVWTMLYIFMGIAFFLVWKSNVIRPGLKIKATTFYVVQLILNFSWSVIFFYARQPGWAFAEILILLLVIIVTTFYFYKIVKLAGWLMFPYILWVCFATILNYSIWQLNT